MKAAALSIFLDLLWFWNIRISFLKRLTPLRPQAPDTDIRVYMASVHNYIHEEGLFD